MEYPFNLKHFGTLDLYPSKGTLVLVVGYSELRQPRRSLVSGITSML